MNFSRSDMIGAGCALAAICLVAWLSLDSWAITRCDEFISSGAYQTATELTAEQQACVDERLPSP